MRWVHEAGQLQNVTTLAWQAKQEAMLAALKVTATRSGALEVRKYVAVLRVLCVKGAQVRSGERNVWMAFQRVTWLFHSACIEFVTIVKQGIRNNFEQENLRLQANHCSPCAGPNPDANRAQAPDSSTAKAHSP